LGPNVVVIDPSMTTSQIQATVDAISTQQIPMASATADTKSRSSPARTAPTSR